MGYERIEDKLIDLIYDLERLDIWLDNPASEMTLGEYEDKRKELIESCAKSIEESVGAGTCKAKLYKPEYGTSDCTVCECGEINDISAIYCNRCGKRIEVGER